MASFSMEENWVMFDGNNSFEGSELSGMNAAFLMSLLEESIQGEEHYDNERLSILIQSLEAELDPNGKNGNDTTKGHLMGPGGHDCWLADCCCWNIDAEMGSPPSSSRDDDDDISLWYPIGDQMDDMV